MRGEDWKSASARAPTPTREGACAPRIPAPERPVFPAGSLVACEGSHSTPGSAMPPLTVLEADSAARCAVSSDYVPTEKNVRIAS